MSISDGRSRVVIETVTPEIDGGRFAIKRVPGETVRVEADIYTDGHDAVSAVVRYRDAGENDWQEVPMELLVNDRWAGEFIVRNIGTAGYAIQAWVDHFKSWARDFRKRLDALDLAPDVDPGVADPDEFTSGATTTDPEQMEIGLQREIGARLIDDAAARAPEAESAILTNFAAQIRDDSADPEIALDLHLADLMFQFAERQFVTDYPGATDSSDAIRSTEVAFLSTALTGGIETAEAEVNDASGEHQAAFLKITVDRSRARFSTWYELFPRSMSPVEGKHGTLKDVEEFLPRVATMGFDVLYLPPIHPIGRSYRKGPNNAPPSPDDPLAWYEAGELGSPWAIGSAEGGHKAIHPELGTVDDFRSLVDRARQHEIDIALDLAYQCSPDHPYVSEHPEWFRQRPDGTIQYAENPPKKYQDIYPFDFETSDWENLWLELESVIRYWIDLGVRVFRVDNPHTKSFYFWEWTIKRLKAEFPDLIFLSEAFTRPKVMSYLAKIGFTQSYTYFTWRNSRWELEHYLHELTRTEQAEYFRPNFWPNTPDILHEMLQVGGRPAFMQRLVMAATLTASYGIYGPAYELCENEPAAPGSEEYLNSEKYQIRQRDLDQPASLRDFITRVNRIRHQHPALQRNDTIEFHPVDNDQLMAYTKHSPEMNDLILTVVSTDPHYTQSGWLDFPIERFNIDSHQPYLIEDLLNDEKYLWHGSRNFVELNPQQTPAHIFRVRRRMRREADFEYYG